MLQFATVAKKKTVHNSEGLMDSKLQQAIVAARAGRPTVAQHLLAALIREQPDNADAWYLLSQLVNSDGRQVQYLRQALELEPDHQKAKERLLQLSGPVVPAPVIKVEVKKVQPEIVEEPLTPTANLAAPVADRAPGQAPPTPAAPTEGLPEWLQDLENKGLGSSRSKRAVDDQWRNTAGSPKRAPAPPAVAIEAAANKPQAAPDPGQRTPSDAWLIRILIVMVIVAALVLALLVLLVMR